MATIEAVIISFIGVTIFAAINLYIIKISNYMGKNKIKILSFFGGVTATYVFLDLLPSLQYSNMYLQQLGADRQFIQLYEDSIFLVVLIGFLIFFSLEHVAVNSRGTENQKNGANPKQTRASKRIFLIHLLTVAFLDFVISFVFIFEFETGIVTATLYGVAISMHLFISSETMVEQYRSYQAKFGRYVLAAVPLLGWIASLLIPETIAQAYVLLAFISGVILYHSIRNEIPTSFKRGSLVFFLIGALIYATILIGHALSVA